MIFVFCHDDEEEEEDSPVVLVQKKISHQSVILSKEVQYRKKSTNLNFVQNIRLHYNNQNI